MIYILLFLYINIEASLLASYAIFQAMLAVPVGIFLWKQFWSQASLIIVDYRGRCLSGLPGDYRSGGGDEIMPACDPGITAGDPEPVSQIRQMHREYPLCSEQGHLAITSQIPDVINSNGLFGNVPL
jgi:hypothetical protein